MKPLGSAGSPGIAGPTSTGSVTVRLTSILRSPANTTPRSDLGEVDAATNSMPSWASRSATIVLGLGAEHLQRALLGRHEGQLDPVHAQPEDVPGRHHRQLVKRQGPATLLGTTNATRLM